MYEQEGEVDWQGNLEIIVLWLHKTTATLWSVPWKCILQISSLWQYIVETHSKPEQIRFWEIFHCLEIKMVFLIPGDCPNVSQLLVSFSFLSGKGEARTASSPRLFWKTTTLHSRTPSTRAGTWLLHARAAPGRPPRPSNTRGRPTSWSVYPGGTCWVRRDRLMFFLSLSPRTLSTSGLNIPTTSAQGDAEDWNHWGRTVDEPAQKNHYKRKPCASCKLTFPVKCQYTFCLIFGFDI